MHILPDFTYRLIMQKYTNHYHYHIGLTKIKMKSQPLRKEPFSTEKVSTCIPCNMVAIIFTYIFVIAIAQDMADRFVVQTEVCWYYCYFSDRQPATSLLLLMIIADSNFPVGFHGGWKGCGCKNSGIYRMWSICKYLLWLQKCAYTGFLKYVVG